MIYIYMIFVSIRHIPLRSGKWQTPKNDSWWSRDQIEQLHSRGVSFAIQDLRIRTPTLVLFQFPRRSPNFPEVFLGLRLLGVWSSHSKKQILSWSTNPFHKFRCFRCSVAVILRQEIWNSKKYELLNSGACKTALLHSLFRWEAFFSTLRFLSHIPILGGGSHQAGHQDFDSHATGNYGGL